VCFDDNAITLKNGRISFISGNIRSLSPAIKMGILIF
jgi:hypothetical protein